MGLIVDGAAEGVDNSPECSQRISGHCRAVPKCSRLPTEEGKVTWLKKERRRALCAIGVGGGTRLEMGKEDEDGVD